MGRIWDIYCWIWFTTQFWWEKSLRRPYTFVFHDLSHSHPVIYWSIQIAIVAVMAVFISPWVLLCILYGFIQGHCIWADWEIGQQEEEEYLGD